MREHYRLFYASMREIVGERMRLVRTAGTRHRAGEIPLTRTQSGETRLGH
jgi:hypothetical protein